MTFLLLLSLSCSSEKSGEMGRQKDSESVKEAVQGASQSVNESSALYGIRISPEKATTDSTIVLSPQGFDLAAAKIEWLVNGKTVASPIPNQFKPSGVRKGDKVQVRAMIGGREVLSDIVQIRNAPPQITDAKIVPESGQGGSLSVETAVRDADGDNITLQYEWTKNGEPAGNGKRIIGPLKRGDKISVRITAFDGEEYGNTVVLNREIANMPPVVMDDKKVSFDGKVYIYQIKAADPDGDALTYSLKSGPPGMTVDGSRGIVRWEVPKEFVGAAPASVIVSDGHGGDITHIFTAIISRDK
ncbi:MAG TPA: Ig-like domain-containing protein [Thermodesulfovibrionales bacterium]|nr:Ig-like domain-containing protein [Thermodesulfovibrionales bacterium]